MTNTAADPADLLYPTCNVDDLNDPLGARLLASDLRVGVNHSPHMLSLSWAKGAVLSESGAELLVDVVDQRGNAHPVIISVRVVE